MEFVRQDAHRRASVARSGGDAADLPRLDPVFSLLIRAMWRELTLPDLQPYIPCLDRTPSTHPRTHTLPPPIQSSLGGSLDAGQEEK